MLNPFTLTIGPSTGSDGKLEVTSFDSLNVKYNLITGDTIGFNISGSSAEAAFVDELASDLWLWGPLPQRFRIIGADQSWGPDGGSVIAVTGVSYNQLFVKRFLHTALDYAAGTDQGDIIWALVAHAQAQTNGNLGITHGLTTTGVLRERHYFTGDNIGDLISKLAGVINGTVWRVDVAKVLTAKLPTAFATAAQPLIIGVNGSAFARKTNVASFANAVYGDAGEGTTPIWQDAATIATDPRGRWEEAVSYDTVTLQSGLADHVAGELVVAQSPAATWTANIDPSRWLTDSFYTAGLYVQIVKPRDAAAEIGIPAPSALIQVGELGLVIGQDGLLSVGLSANEIVKAT